MAVLKKRQRIILSTLKDLGGIATTRKIAEKANMSVSGVSQTLGALECRDYVERFGSGRGSETRWKLIG